VEILTAVVGALLAAGALVLLLRRGEREEVDGARDAAVVLVCAFAVPLLLAATHAVDVYDGRNAIGNWVPFGLLVACGLGTFRAPRATAVLGGGLVALSLGVIAAIDVLPAYQRDDWRGIANALGSGHTGLVVVSERFGQAPLSIYLPEVEKTTARTVTAREVAYVSLRVRHTGGAPSPAPVPSGPPAGFRLVGVTRSEAFAVARYRAPRVTTVATKALQRVSPEAESEVSVQG
jgi:hypothetical protein